MIHKKHNMFLVWMVYLAVQTHQKELGIDQDLNEESFETSDLKWDSIFEDSEPAEFSEENHNLNVLNFFEKEPLKKGNFKLSNSEKKHLSDDEVFVNEDNNVHGSPNAENNKENLSDKQINPEILRDSNPMLAEKTTVEFPLEPQQIIAENVNSQNSAENSQIKQQSESNMKFENSLMATIHQTNVVDPRSFIFNPNAKPQEQFQNCTTPINESGSCRYLQHCLIPTIISSLNQFMGYVCIIEEQFIGVCCPNLPVSVITIKDEKNPAKSKNDDKKECGVGTNRRIVGGSNADPKAWPWMVALLSNFGKTFYCGGVLINDRYVLTTAHCTFGNEIIARLGEYDFKNDGEPHIEYAVTEIKRHGHFNRRSLKNDIALLKLEKSVVFNDFIETICFPEEEKSYVGERATLVGWGRITGGGSTINVLQQASLPVVSNADCSKGHGLPMPSFLICTSSESGDKGACNGDSGGPLMLLDKNNRWKVIGLVSWGRRGCNPEFPTVYTRVSHYLEWIEKHST